MDKLRYFAGRRDLIFSGVYLVLAVLTANSYLWYGPNLGLGIGMSLLTLVTAFYLWPARRRVTLYGAACLVGALACGVSMAWSDDSLVKKLALLLSLTLNTCAVVQKLGLWKRPRGTFRRIGDLFCWGIGYPIGHCGGALYALFHRQGPEGTVQSRRTGSVLLGVLCALPALMILVPLLISSDAAFAGLLERLDLAAVVEIILSLLLGLGLWLVLFSQGFLLPRYQPQPPVEKMPRRGIEPVGMTAFLAVICTLYALYLLSQLAYFFSGFAGILPEGYTAAEYARRGFFEMTAVCAINLLLIFLCLLTVRKKQGREPLSVRLLCLFICLFSLVLIAASVSKMTLYINTYGMTRLRILTSAFMLVLAVCLLCVTVRLFARRFAYMGPILVVTAVVILGLNFVNCDRLIAEYNYNAWQSGQLAELDMDHLGELNAAAVPVLWEIAQSEDAELARQAQARLSWWANLLIGADWDAVNPAPEGIVPPPMKPQPDPRSWNRDTARAVELLYDHWYEYYIVDFWEYLYM